MSARKIYRPVREVEHLFDAHYRASRPRRRIIRVCGGVRGRGRWVTSPGAFTLLFFALLLPRLLALSHHPVGIYLSPLALFFVLLSLFSSSVTESFSLGFVVYQLPAKVTEQQLGFTNRDLSPVLCIRCASLSSSSPAPMAFLFQIRGSSVCVYRVYV